MTSGSPIGTNTRISALAFACLVALSTASASTPEYDLVDLGTLEGGLRSYALSISESGIIAGWASGAQIGKNPVLWVDGVIQDLGPPPGWGVGEAGGVNDAGQAAVTGESGNPQSYHGYFWEDGTYTDLGTLPEGGWCIPKDIDELGRIVGWCGWKAFIWEAGEMSDLGTLSFSARAYGINEMGQVVGHCRGGTGDQQAFLWEDGVMTELDPLPGRDNAQAFGLNDLGDVVGSSWYPTGPYSLSVDRATLWRDGGAEIVDLGRTPGPPICSGEHFYPDNIALAVNNHGQVVGHAQCIASGGSLAAFLWQDGVNYNLNDLIPPGSGWDLIKATDINDAGQIVGFGLAPGGSYLRAFLLEPADAPANVPEAGATNRFGLRVSPIPLGPTTQVSYVLPGPGPVRITVHDVAGRRVATLLDRFQPAGHHSLMWSPNAPGGETSGNGVCFLCVASNGGIGVKKLVYLGR